MNIFLYIIIFIMGSLFGSFFTLAVYRLPLKKDITHERSYCPNCGHKLSFLDLIPILSYIFLRGKCRYCKQKIRPRYLLLEVLSGLVFVLFAMSLNINIYSLQVSQVIYFLIGILYLATLFIIAGIDKENYKIEKSVLLFGYLIEAAYIIYLYIVEGNSNIYRYVIYLALFAILTLINVLYMRKNAKDSYTTQILLLCILFLVFTGEAVTILTITFTLLTIAFDLLLNKMYNAPKNKSHKTDKKENIKIPIGFYLCATNIICLIIADLYMCVENVHIGL